MVVGRYFPHRMFKKNIVINYELLKISYQCISQNAKTKSKKKSVRLSKPKQISEKNTKSRKKKMAQNQQQLQGKADALRQLATLLEKKEAVPDQLWTDAGVKKNSRLKDVQVAIKDLKKKVSVIQKEANASSEEEGEEGEAQEVEKKRQDTRAKKDVRRLGLDKKNLTEAVANGAFNMEREFA
jgi:hypothetical protein